MTQFTGARAKILATLKRLLPTIPLTRKTCAPCRVNCNEGRACPVLLSEQRQTANAPQQPAPHFINPAAPPDHTLYRVDVRLDGGGRFQRLVRAPNQADAFSITHAHFAKIWPQRGGAEPNLFLSIRPAAE